MLRLSILFMQALASETTTVLVHLALSTSHCWMYTATVVFLSSQLNAHILALQTPCLMMYFQKMEMDY